MSQSKAINRMRRAESATAYACLAPSLIGLVCITYLPLLAVFGLSFFNWKCIILYVIMLAFYHRFKKLHPIWIILICAAAGMLLL